MAPADDEAAGCGAPFKLVAAPLLGEADTAPPCAAEFASAGESTRAGTEAAVLVAFVALVVPLAFACGSERRIDPQISEATSATTSSGTAINAVLLTGEAPLKMGSSGFTDTPLVLLSAPDTWGRAAPDALICSVLGVEMSAGGFAGGLISS